MESTIRRKLNSLKRRTRRLLLVRGVLQTVCATLLAVTLFALSDYAFRPDSVGVRLAASLSVLAFVLWMLQRYMFVPLRTPLSDVALAMVVARRFPQVAAVLPSAVEFLSEQPQEALAGVASRERTGPPARGISLRSATVAEAEQACRNIAFDETLHERSTWRWMITTALSLAILGGVLLWRPVLAWTAWERLSRPMGDVAWPQEHQLGLLWDIDRVEKGGRLTFAVYDRRGAPLPEDAELLIRTHDEETDAYRVVRVPLEVNRSLERRIFEPNAAALLGGSDSPLQRIPPIAGARTSLARQSGLLVAELTDIQRPLAFRIVGGDDRTMPWQTVQVLSPPTIVSASAVIVPPEYSQLTTRVQDCRSTSPMAVLPGTEVKITVETGEPLRHAVLEDQLGGEAACEFIDGDRTQIRAATTIDESKRLRLRVTDERRLTVLLPCEWAFDVVEDTPPRLLWRWPVGNLRVLANADIPLEAELEEDVGLENVALSYRILRANSAKGADSTEMETHQIDLSEAFAQAEDLADQGPQEPAPAEQLGVRPLVHRVLRYPWRLSSPHLSVGDVVQFHLEATDLSGATARSASLRLEVVGQRGLALEIDARRRNLAETLQESRDVQAACIGQTQLAAGAWAARTSPELDAPDQERFLPYQQQQVRELLSDPGRGAVAQIGGLIRDMRMNHVADDAALTRLEQLRSAIVQLESRQVAESAALLEQAAKTASLWRSHVAWSEDAASPERLADAKRLADDTLASLSASLSRQQVALRRLDAMLADLSQWASGRRYVRSLEEMIGNQLQLRDRAVAMAGQTLGKPSHLLSASDAAAIGRIAEDQRALASQFENLRRERAKNGGTDMPGADALSSEMRRAAGMIGENRLAEGAKLQSQIAEQLARIAGQGRAEQLSPTPAEAPLQSEQARFREMANRQQVLLTETSAVAQRIELEGPSRATMAALIAIADRQARLTDDVRQASAEPSLVAIVKTFLVRAETDMRFAVESLGRGDVSEAVLAAQSRAHVALEAVAGAFATAPSPGPSSSEPKEPGDGEKGEDQRKQDMWTLVQLRLARAEQADLHGETQRIEQAALEQTLTTEERATETSSLSVRQAELAELIERRFAPLGQDVNEASAAERFTEEETDKLDDIAGKMHIAAALLAESDKDARVTGLQEDVLLELDDLIRTRTPVPGDGPAPSGDSGTNGEDQPPTSPESPNGPTEDDPNKPQPIGAGPGTEGGPGGAGANGETVDPATENGPDDIARRRELLDRVWGGLPESVRERVRQHPSEEFLPGYRGQIESYYRSLATEPAPGAP